MPIWRCGMWCSAVRRWKPAPVGGLVYARCGTRSPVLVNMYGITETTVHVTYLPMSAELAADQSRSLIGGGIPDLRVYVLDESGRVRCRSG